MPSTMNWNTASEIATTIGALLTGFSIASGFVLYYWAQRDERIRRFRESITNALNISETLDRLLNYEAAYESFHAVAQTGAVKFILQQVFSQFFSNQSPSSISLEDHLRSDMLPIGTSIHSPIVEAFESRLDELQLEASRVQFDHPGVARVMFACHALMGNALHAHMKLMRDEDAWRKALVQLHKDTARRDRIQSVEMLTLQLEDLFVSTSQRMLRDHHQKAIDDCLQILNLIITAYLRKEPGQIRRISRFERGLKMRTREEMQTIPEDLKEAEKCFGTALSRDELLKYRELTTRMDR